MTAATDPPRDLAARLAQALDDLGPYDPHSGPCACCRTPCERYGPTGRPLCPTCQPQT